MSVVDWVRAVLAGLGVLVALFTLRHALDVHRQYPDGESPVNWLGVLAFAVLAFASAGDMLRDTTKHVPFHWSSAAYAAAYVLGAISLTRNYRIAPKGLRKR